MHNHWQEGFVFHRIQEIDMRLQNMYPDEMLLTVRRRILCYPFPLWNMGRAVHLPMKVHLDILDYLCSLEVACLGGS